jgi:hypothetical protein
MNRGFALLLFMSGCAAAKKEGKARLRAMHSIVIKKRGRNATLPQLIKPHVLGSNDAWKNAKKLCDGNTRLQERPILVFVHVFKSAGTTTRETLKQWSARREIPTATCRFVSAGRCGGGGAARRLTFASFARLLRPRRRRLGSANALCTSGARVAVPRPDVDVVAGHLWFGTLPASRPAIYVTCLRDPVVLRVSGALYLRLKRYDALSLEDVAADVAAGFVKKADREKPYYANFVKRLGAAEPMSRFGSYVSGAVASESARRAARVLDESFAVVGLTEKYGLFIEMLRKLLPLKGDAAGFWRDEAARRDNANRGKHSTCAVLNALGADARRALNRTVAYERKVYAAAVAVHDRRCAERLGKEVCKAVPARTC